MSDGKIFISYRRADSAYAARLLFDRLSARFGEDNIFMDVEGLDPGEDFVESLEQAVSSCNVLLALIGQQWLTAKDEQGQPRLDNPEDFVRLEVAAALKRAVLVIPILVEDARMPGSDELPEALDRLARLNALEIRHERFDADADHLADAIEKHIQDTAREQVRPNQPGEQAALPDQKQPPVRRLSTVPCGLWFVGGGIGLILILALAFWGGNVLLTSIRTSQTPQPDAPTSFAEIITNTAAPNAILTPGVSSEGITAPIPNDDGESMALVPAGPFEMGSEDGRDDEKPIHTVTLDDFYIDQYEVTNARYAECVEAGPCNPPLLTKSDSVQDYYGNAEFADYPMINVNWYEAQIYCKWREARLPTEAEWEKAGRGGLEGKLYPWGNQSPDCTLTNFYYGKYCVGDTNVVGSYDPNGYGLYDMAGNVSEWIYDSYDAEYFTYSPTSNPQGPESGKTRILRGGSWHLVGRDLPVAYRDNYYPNLGRIDIGFRCLRDLVP